MSLSVLGEAVMRELNRDAQFDNRQPCWDQDDDVTSASRLFDAAQAGAAVWGDVPC